MTEALAAAGAAVVVHHLDQPAEAAAFAAELEEAGARAFPIHCDLTNWEQTQQMYASIGDSLGPVSILVNNAGMMRKETFANMTLDDWRTTMTVDLDGVFVATRLALPGMLTAGRGSVIMVSSQLAFRGAHDYVAYSAAKGGIIGFTRALAREVGPTIRVNAVAPGPVQTPMTDAYTTPEWVAERTQGMVLRRLGRPEELAPAIVFLASSGSDWMHGQTLHLNGGGVMA
jgi:3-oxoacyl-[acyl-carrier protein] reductase